MRLQASLTGKTSPLKSVVRDIAVSFKEKEASKKSWFTIIQASVRLLYLKLTRKHSVNISISSGLWLGDREMITPRNKNTRGERHNKKGRLMYFSDSFL